MTDLTTPIIVDGHLDIAWNYFNNRRDFRQSAWARRRQETDPVFLQRYGHSMVGLPELLVGRVAVVCASIFVAPAWSKTYPDEQVLYTSPEEAHRWGKQQLAYYHRLAEEDPRLCLILTQADLNAVLDTWRDSSDVTEHRLGLIIGMEGADPILEPAQLEEWYAEGLRVVGPAWTQTRYSGGTKAPGPLTDLGRALLEVMADLHMVLDLAHMAPEACLEALDRYDGPLFASHANPLRFRPDRPDRNLSDDLIRRIAERDGAVGIMPYNLFLLPDWRPGERKDAASMDHVIAAIDHVCQITGSARHVGIGSDFDGSFGAASTPAEFETSADLWAIGQALAARGYTPADVGAILGGNFLRILRAGLPA
jgi:membrane dipeptidase